MSNRLCAESNPLCDCCDQVITSGNVVEIDDGREYVCEDCAECYYYRCDDCGEYVSARRLWADRNMTICDFCSDEYCICEDCGAVIHSENIHYIDGEYYCDDCESAHRNVIHDYSHKPTPIFYGGNAARGYYGLELEIDDGYDKREAAQSIQGASDDCIYLKHDGSLSDDGFEIVTHPATLDYHIKNFPWRNICQAALNYDYRSHDTDTCGLHIHASRSLFGNTETEQDLTIAKIMLLIDRWYDSYIVRFARRNLARMRRWADKPNADIQPGDDDGTAVDKSKKSANGRYKAINLCNHSTVEFRFFRGTLRRDTIIASIQWVDTIIQYCRNTPLKNLWSSSWEEIFCNTEHAELTNYLKQRKLYNVKEEN